MVGRLIEVDVRAGYRTVRDMEELTDKLMQTIGDVPETVRPVIIADWRTCGVLTPAVAEAAAPLMMRTNARIERSAILHATDASTSVLQMMRLIREAEAPHRQLFTDPHALQLWLSDVLNPAERDRLRAFLFSPRPSSTSRL